MHVLLPDDTQLDLPEDASGADAAAAIGPGLARAALAGRGNGEGRDLARALGDGERNEIITAKSDGDPRNDAPWLVRHHAAHVLAAAGMEADTRGEIPHGPP